MILEIIILDGIFLKGPFKYYVIMFLTFLGPTTHLFDDVMLEWSLTKVIIHKSSGEYFLWNRN